MRLKHHDEALIGIRLASGIDSGLELCGMMTVVIHQQGLPALPTNVTKNGETPAHALKARQTAQDRITADTQL